jgi:hypothetical protein
MAFSFLPGALCLVPGFGMKPLSAMEPPMQATSPITLHLHFLNAFPHVPATTTMSIQLVWNRSKRLSIHIWCPRCAAEADIFFVATTAKEMYESLTKGLFGWVISVLMLE